MTDPFHVGEKQIQELTGERSAATVNSRLIANVISPTAQQFIAQRQFCVLGWVAADGDIWATILVGDQGFVTSDELGGSLKLVLSDFADPVQNIPPFSKLRENDSLGILFIDLSKRRRLRVNGSVTALSAGDLAVSVAEVFPNCPKYIQRRELLSNGAPATASPIDAGCGLTDEIKTLISNADTFFVASAGPGGSVDASHRGGKPGFVKIESGRLRIPDYPGNSMFNTLGNFAVNPCAGLIFVDFNNDRQLQLTGDVDLRLTTSKNMEDTGGTGRWWHFTPRRWIVSALNRAVNWRLIDNSPFNP